MYFDFEDYHPDIAPVGRAISWREGVLLSIIVHLVMIIVVILLPKYLPDNSEARAHALQQLMLDRQKDAQRFVFVAPRRERPIAKAPTQAELSDLDRAMRAPQKPPNPTNPLPFSRGNTPERIDQAPQQAMKAPEPAPQEKPAAEPPPQGSPQQVARLPDLPNALQMPNMKMGQQGSPTGRGTTGAIGDALQHLQRYIERDAFDNPQGSGQFGPEIQFDTKGVEFGPWIRRFIAQVKRNWFIPYAAMSMKGHVVITFNIHKDGTITDLSVVGPSGVDAFNNAAFGALSASNPTQPLPPEYPADKAFFTVTFYYNETPPR